MKTGAFDGPLAAPIVQLLDAPAEGDAAGGGTVAVPGQLLDRARAFAAPLIEGRPLGTGEDALEHADGVAAILRGIGAAPTLQAASWLVHAADFLTRPEEVIATAFGASQATLVARTRKLVAIQRGARETLARRQAASPVQADRGSQVEGVRRMLLAFSNDLRVVLLRLASRLQTLRHHAQSRTPCPAEVAEEALQVFAPLANRLGIWQIKWELEDLAFRFLRPDDYRRVAGLLDGRRVEREARVERARQALAATLRAAGIDAEVQGRPKHLYSIWKKMQGKGLDFAQVFDVRALRVIVASVADCYAALACVHAAYAQVAAEFDDYIARPKGNGYQSLHTVVLIDDAVEDKSRTVEVQIRTRAMHEHAEHGVAAHWAYKEAGPRGYGGAAVVGNLEAQRAEARRNVLRQLLAWERDLAARGPQEGAGVGGGEHGEASAPALAPAVVDDRIYVFTPQAGVIELPRGATAIDFAYAVHTDLGHRCRGARVDGRVVPLDTPLASGQTVEIVVAKEGGPSLDWLKPDAGYLGSSRSRTKVRAWFNALAQRDTIARGREAVEKLLQREGRTSIKLGLLASRLGFRSADALFEVVGKDEFSLRNIEALLRPAEPVPSPDEAVALKLQRGSGEAAPSAAGGVLVVGVESLLTTLARCCRPAPPDAIGGYVTRGKGVAVHRAACSNFRQMAERSPERVIAVAWGAPRAGRAGREGADVYPVDVVVEAADRPGLLRDVLEVFAKDKMNVAGVNTQSVRDAAGGTAWMTFTVEVDDSQRLAPVLARVRHVTGVRGARRR